MRKMFSNMITLNPRKRGQTSQILNCRGSLSVLIQQWSHCGHVLGFMVVILCVIRFLWSHHRQCFGWRHGHYSCVIMCLSLFKWSHRRQCFGWRHGHYSCVIMCLSLFKWSHRRQCFGWRHGHYSCVIMCLSLF